MRRLIQRRGIKHTLFLDETYRRVGDISSHTIVLPGQHPYVETSSTTRYAKRWDMIACINGTTTLPPIIYAPNERGKGITKNMLINYCRDLLAQAAGALDVYPLILVWDRSPIHNNEEVEETFHDWGCQELVQVVKMPPSAAKRMSPLDNALFNIWRQRTLSHGPLNKYNIKTRMNDAWNSLTANDIKAQYHHCGLIRGQDVYFDCPNPIEHAHTRRTKKCA